jgi:hypothetical protein
MKSRFFEKKLIILSTTLVFLQAHADSAIQKGADLATTIKSMIPSQTAQCSIDKIMKLVSPEEYHNSDIDVGMSNKGIDSRSTNFMNNNSCLQNQVREFWGNITKSGDTSLGGLVTGPRPNITEHAGEGRFAKLKPGWLWQEALKVTKGDNNLAMAFVGVCGNDDVSSSFEYRIPDHIERDRLRERRDELKKQLAEVRMNQKGMESSQASFKNLSLLQEGLDRQIREIEGKLSWKTIGRNSKWSCPNGSNGAYAPKALDETTDLPDQLKSQIIKDQRPNGNVQTLSAKGYHYVGGALVGCELARCGLSPETAAKVAGTVAMFYRAVRLCPEIKNLLLQQENLEQTLGMKFDNPNYAAAVIKYRTDVEDSSGWADLMNPNVAANKRAENNLIQMDAATLFSKWYLGGPESNIPCTGIRIGGPSELNSPTTRPGQNTCGIVGWSAERCNNAQKKLANWDLDSRFTQAQHEIGAKFGASKCSQWNEEKSIDKICDRSPTSPRAPTAPADQVR